MTRVKICGIRSLDEALAASRLGAWAIGEVFAPSPRRIEIDRAAAINRELNSGIIKVGVFVNEDVDELKRIARISKLDIIQVHGEEPPEYLEEIDLPLIKAFSLKRPVEPERLRRWPAWAYLFDTSSPGVKGGSGRTFNWQWLEAIKGWRNMILAGGLNEDNVFRAINCVRPMAVDVSSGVEFSRGGKDPEKVSNFIQKVKEADAYVS